MTPTIHRYTHVVCTIQVEIPSIPNVIVLNLRGNEDHMLPIERNRQRHGDRSALNWSTLSQPIIHFCILMISVSPVRNTLAIHAVIVVLLHASVRPAA